MIINIWRPSRKNLNKKSIVVRYDMCNIEDIYRSGSTSLKVIYKCDFINCKFPNKIHSISRHHLNINRSINMHENLQICRSCQTSGSNNPKYGDNRTWDQLMGKERSREMKKIYRDRFTGVSNPSKCEIVKKKKKQIIINFENISKFVDKSGYTLSQISGENKHAVLSIYCDKGHLFNMRYHAFKRGHRCIFCYYYSLKIPIGDIKDFEKYSKVVRYKSVTSFRRHKHLIDPFNLKSKDSKNYHIDHIYSIADGFRNNIDPMIVSSMVNLRVITSDENLKKSCKSDIELEDLLKMYSKIVD